MVELRPIVKKPRLLRNGGLETGRRCGKGFSLRELALAGLTVEKGFEDGHTRG